MRNDDVEPLVIDRAVPASPLELLEAWVAAHGPLTGTQAQKFIHKPEVVQLARCDKQIALAAVRRHPKLVDALADAQARAGCPTAKRNWPSFPGSPRRLASGCANDAREGPV